MGIILLRTKDMIQIALEFCQEYDRARETFKPFGTIGHGLETMREEFDELIAEARKKDIDKIKLRKEAIQHGAMALAFIFDLIDNNKMNTENMVKLNDTT